MLLGDIIKKYRDEHNLSQRDFAKKCKLSHTYIAALEKKIDTRSGKAIAPTVDAVKNISKGLNMPLQELLNIIDDEQEFIISPAKTIKIPVVGTVAAGEPILAQENIIDYEELPASDFKDGEYFGLIVKGNSMFPRILERDVVIVRKQDDCENGQIAVVLINGDEATIKQVKKTESGIMLIPFNTTEFEPMFFTKEDIEKKPVKIVGIVKRLIGYNFD